MPKEIKTPLQSPDELLQEKVSDNYLTRTSDARKREALYALAEIAIPAVLRAAAAGNIQCQQAAEKMAPYLPYL